MYVFCDLTYAFYCVNHELLVKKVEFFRFRGVLLNWLRSYLNDRKQMVHLKLLKCNKISNWCNVDLGVPQGSVFGLYINL